ncbi:hypothetical protein SNEBB_004286 [Seison nebaliae]|nr:hypothetical protein SNEBB_004286 [Seison nebaliae]
MYGHLGENRAFPGVQGFRFVNSTESMRKRDSFPPAATSFNTSYQAINGNNKTNKNNEEQTRQNSINKHQKMNGKKHQKNGSSDNIQSEKDIQSNGRDENNGIIPLKKLKVESSGNTHMKNGNNKKMDHKKLMNGINNYQFITQNGKELDVKLMKRTSSNDASEERYFSNRYRLFIGGLSSNVTEDEFKALFAPFGDLGEAYLNSSKGYGFIKLRTREEAETAIDVMDGCMFKGRTLTVRFALSSTSILVKNLSVSVSKEYLKEAFSMFGEVERAIVKVDDKGKSIGEGIVEFDKKSSCTQAIRKCTEGFFLLTNSTRPVQVEKYDMSEFEDGYSEKMIDRTPEFEKDREQSPRFAGMNSLEFKIAARWRKLDNDEKSMIDRVKKHIELERNALEMEMTELIMNHHTKMLRKELKKKEDQLRDLQQGHEVNKTSEILKNSKQNIEEMMHSMDNGNNQYQPFDMVNNSMPMDGRMMNEDAFAMMNRNATVRPFCEMPNRNNPMPPPSNEVPTHLMSSISNNPMDMPPMNVAHVDRKSFHNGMMMQQPDDGYELIAQLPPSMMSRPMMHRPPNY